MAAASRCAPPVTSLSCTARHDRTRLARRRRLGPLLPARLPAVWPADGHSGADAVLFGRRPVRVAAPVRPSSRGATRPEGVAASETDRGHAPGDGSDGAGYLLAVDHVDREQVALVAALEDIFVAVALLTVSVGLVLPGMIAHAAEEVARAADHLATGTLADLVRAIQALGVGDLDAAHARVDVVPVRVHTGDELGAMAASFNIMQENVAAAAIALDGAREGLRLARTDLEVTHTTLQASEERNRLALRAANMGTWDVEFVSNVC